MPSSQSVLEIFKQISKMTIQEIIDLTQLMEKEFNISASAPVATTVSAAPAESTETRQEEKTEFSIVLTGFSSQSQKLPVVKAVRETLKEISKEVSLIEAKNIVDGTANAPYELASGIDKAKAEEVKKKLEAAGATVELK